MNLEQKIDDIFRIMSKINSRMAVSERRHEETEKIYAKQEGKIGAIEEAIISFKEERARLGMLAKLSGFIFGFLGTIIGGIILAFITHFIK